ncbi:MAG: hypothetical protein JXR49_04105 [Acidobacteria bacterium]|nr:hypothetical protein [Acidobacteriota bacterium]
MLRLALQFLSTILLVSPIFYVNETKCFRPDDLIYQGAFRLPETGAEEFAWKWSGEALEYRSDGNARNSESDLPGSLLGSGHNWHQWVSEITIPMPVVSSNKNLNDLNTAKTLQKFSNITGELYKNRYLEQARMGLAYLPASDDSESGFVYFCRAAHLDQEGKHPSFGMCAVDFADPQPKGLWNIGGLANYYTDDYLLTIPAGWASRHTRDKRLACGRFRDGGQASQGPTLFAVSPVDAEDPPQSGAELDAVTLLKYAAVADENHKDTLKGYRHSDHWSGAVWMENNDKSAVLFIGTKGIGKTWYGFANGLVWPEQPPYPEEPEYPNDQRGWWSERFEPQILFFDPDELAKVAAGMMLPHEPQPYATMNIDNILFLPAVERTRQMSYLGASACDRKNGLLFVMEILVDREQPIIHVWKLY